MAIDHLNSNLSLRKTVNLILSIVLETKSTVTNLAATVAKRDNEMCKRLRSINTKLGDLCATAIYSRGMLHTDHECNEGKAVSN